MSQEYRLTDKFALMCLLLSGMFTLISAGMLLKSREAKEEQAQYSPIVEPPNELQQAKPEPEPKPEPKLPESQEGDEIPDLPLPEELQPEPVDPQPPRRPQNIRPPGG